MGIIKRTVSTKTDGAAITIIAEGNRFHGDTQIVGKLHVDGTLDGNIECDGDISIGRKGTISGYLRAKEITVTGLVDGELLCHTLHIEKGGLVRGTISCDSLTITDGGQFVGQRRLPADDGLSWEVSLAQWVKQRTDNGESAETDPEDDRIPELEADQDNDSTVIDSLPDHITLVRKENAES